MVIAVVDATKAEPALVAQAYGIGADIAEVDTGAEGLVCVAGFLPGKGGVFTVIAIKMYAMQAKPGLGTQEELVKIVGKVSWR